MTDLVVERSGAGAADQLESFRHELTGYCYRMLGSAFEAEDAVQDTMVRAWRAIDRFEGRSSLRSWVYRIATNVCFDALDGRQRRARPMDLGPASSASAPHGGILPEATWVTPIPDEQVLAASDPAERAVERDSIRLAFIAALQHLPPRQRAVLILREVLAWPAAEVASLLDTSVASVNSALQRARATIAERDPSENETSSDLSDEDRELLERYLDAFERYDMVALTALIKEDATQSMPPYELWLSGRDDILTWWAGPGIECKGSRLVRTRANGMPAFAQYRPSGPGGAFEPWSLQVLRVQGGKVVEFTMFLDTEHVFPLFGIPMTVVD
ncbi:sigma-70 family RNA polymerase sigma factor [Angustibacter sp. McL0619]|uniref:sigma-70 family RNA polymerase sigma factor n=1 Tax=Angustibacter sp. McL0619 TaxID=3415676 RepID=UPI003CF5D3D7